MRPIMIPMVVALLALPCARADDGPVSAAASDADDATEVQDEQSPKYQTERLRGKVVWMADGLKEQFGISTVPESAERVLALATNDGRLLPIVENIRGRAFRKDERLRDKEMELLVRRYDAQPMIQILRVYRQDQKSLYEVDYWCDVCAIVMFETGPCSCCQDHNRLRLRLVDDAGETTSTEKSVE